MKTVEPLILFLATLVAQGASLPAGVHARYPSAGVVDADAAQNRDEIANNAELIESPEGEDEDENDGPLSGVLYGIGSDGAGEGTLDSILNGDAEETDAVEDPGAEATEQLHHPEDEEALEGEDEEGVEVGEKEQLEQDMVELEEKLQADQQELEQQLEQDKLELEEEEDLEAGELEEERLEMEQDVHDDELELEEEHEDKKLELEEKLQVEDEEKVGEEEIEDEQLGLDDGKLAGEAKEMEKQAGDVEEEIDGDAAAGLEGEHVVDGEVGEEDEKLGTGHPEQAVVEDEHVEIPDDEETAVDEHAEQVVEKAAGDADVSPPEAAVPAHEDAVVDIGEEPDEQEEHEVENEETAQMNVIPEAGEAPAAGAVHRNA